MAPGLVGAVAAHREILPVREHSQECQQPLRRRLPHLLEILAGERCPSLGRQGRRRRGRNQLGAGGELRQPQVEVVSVRVLLLPHPTRRPADRSQTHAFGGLTGTPQAHDPNRQGSLLVGRVSRTVRPG